MFIFHYLASIIPSALEDEHTSPLSRIRRSAIWSKVCNVLMLCSDDMEAYGRFWWYGRSAIWSKVCNVLAMFWWYGSIWKVLMIWKVSHLIKSVQCSDDMFWWYGSIWKVLMIWKVIHLIKSVQCSDAMFWWYGNPLNFFMGQSRPFFIYFVVFSFQFQLKFQQYKLKKCGWFAWDSNPGRRMVGEKLWRPPLTLQ